MVSGNKVVRRIFESHRDEVIAGGRKLHNEELHKSYSNRLCMVEM
jgi:hypothetical protein